MVQKSWNSVKHFCLCTYVSLFMILMLQSAKQFNLYLVSLYSPVQRKFSGWGGKAEIQGEVLLGNSQLHLHQEDSVMVGEDLVYSLTVTLL